MHRQSSLLVLLAFLTAASSSLGQTSTATLSGTAVDQTGAAVAGVTITVMNTNTGLLRHATTNESGYFTMPLLPPGPYIVQASHEGFNVVETKDVVLHVGDQANLPITLNVGPVSQKVIVEGGAPVVNTESAAVSTVVDRQFVGNLPLNGRSFQSLIALTPGTVLTKPTGNDEGQFSVDGQRANANYFTIDGVGANIGVSTGFGQSIEGSTPGFGAFGSTNNLVSIDALQEFKVQTSTFSPEFGRTPGAQVQILTRSGTNDFHGTAFEYFRNDKLDATDWFANATRQPKPPLRQNDFGGVFGGPILLPRFGEGGHQPGYNGRNRTFFFISFEGLRLRLPQTDITTVPSLNARQTAPASMQPFLNAFARPNGRDLANNFSEFNATYSDPSSLNATSLRIDHIVGSKLTLFARYNYSPSETSQRLASLSNVQFTRVKTETLTAGMTNIFSTSVSNDLRANYSRNKLRLLQTLDDFGGALPPSDSILFPSGHSHNDSTLLYSLSSTFLTVGSQRNIEQRQINLVDTLSATAGSHQLKFGADYRRMSPIIALTAYSQTALFNGVDGAVTGKASSVSIGAAAGTRYPIYTNVSLFGQDTWKAARRLTLTYGLRWEVNPPPHDKNGNNPATFANVDNPATLALAPLGTPLYKTPYNNFAPRVGIAFQLSQAKGRETVLRGGFGRFYDLGSGATALGFGGGFPNTASKSLGAVTFPVDPALASPPTFSLVPPFGTINGAVDPNFKLPYTYQWNFTVERSLGSAQVLSASYVAAIGRRLARKEQFSKPNSTFSSTVNITRNGATSDYHALELQFQRRLSSGLQVLSTYTWSHSLDNSSSDSSTEAPLTRIDPKQERGPSDFDVRHAFNAALTYDIPALHQNGFTKAFLRDFSIDTIFRTRSATPVNVTTGTNAIGGPSGAGSVSRPDLVPGVPLYINDPTVAGGRRINKAAFTTPVGRQGTFGRNALRGFSMWQLDFALRRQFRLTEKLNMQVRAEAFNIFNHPNFSDPGANLNGTNVLTNAQFGQSISMLGRSLGGGGTANGLNPLYQVGGPRSMQLALRLLF